MKGRAAFSGGFKRGGGTTKENLSSHFNKRDEGFFNTHFQKKEAMK
jgi:hypothetical protein